MADEELNEDRESEHVNSMLNAAKKHVGMDDAGGSGSKSDLEAMLDVDDDDDDLDIASGGNDKAGEPAPAEGEDSSDGTESGENTEGEDGAGEESSGKKGKKKKKEKKPKVKKEKKPINKVLVKRIATVAAVLVAACIGFAIPLFMYTDIIKTDSEKFAITAANAVNSRLVLNSEFYVYRCYVHKGTAAEECMLYGLTSYAGEEKLDIYRVVVENDDPQHSINIYYTIDENSEEFQRNLNSTNREISMQYAQLQYHYDNTMQIDELIRSGSEDWEKVDCSVVNRNITSAQSGTANN